MHRNRFQSRLWLLFLSGWLLVSCTSPENKRPDNLIDEDQMADILTEIHIAEARTSRLSSTVIDSANIAYKHLEKQIFKKFSVDTAAYRTSYAFYAAHPQEMEAIYKQVTDKLEKKISAKNAKRP